MEIEDGRDQTHLGRCLQDLYTSTGRKQDPWVPGVKMNPAWEPWYCCPELVHWTLEWERGRSRSAHDLDSPQPLDPISHQHHRW